MNGYLIRYYTKLTSEEVFARFEKEGINIPDRIKMEMIEYIHDRTNIVGLNNVESFLSFMLPNVTVTGPTVDEVYKEFKDRLVSKYG